MNVPETLCEHFSGRQNCNHTNTKQQHLVHLGTHGSWSVLEIKAALTAFWRPEPIHFREYSA